MELRYRKCRTSSVLNALTHLYRRDKGRYMVSANSHSSLRLISSGAHMLLTTAGVNGPRVVSCAIRTLFRGCNLAPYRVVRLGTLVNSSSSGVPKITKINRGATASLVSHFRDVSFVCSGLSALRVGSNIELGLTGNGSDTFLDHRLNAVYGATPVSRGLRGCGCGPRRAGRLTHFVAKLRLFGLVRGVKLRTTTISSGLRRTTGAVSLVGLPLVGGSTAICYRGNR